MSNKHILFTIENPLLDISAHVPKETVEKYGCKIGEAVLANEKQLEVYEDLTNNFQVSYIAGGSSQNTARVFVWMMQEKDSAVFVGSVGSDKYSKFLKEEAEKCGLKTHYHYEKDVPTGTCGVLITGKERTLITNLAAANCYKHEHFMEKETQSLMKEAKFYYSSGYFLTVAPDVQITIGKHAVEHNKVFMSNLSAGFIPMFFKKQLLEVLPYVDYLFGNKDEVEALSQSMEYGTKDVSEIAKKISKYEKVNKKRERVVVFTQGSEAVIVAINGEVTSHKVPFLDPKLIVDMNGAGDAFVGGFVSQLVKGHSLDQCVQAGCYAAQTIIQRDGCTFPEEPTFK